MKRFLPLLLLAGCANSLEDDLAAIRAERIELERKLHVADNAPLWVTEGDEAFDRHLKDDDAQIPAFVYDHLLRKLHKMSADEIRSSTTEGYNYDQCLAAPAAMRGKFWRTTGRISRIWVEKTPGPGLPVDQVYAGVFYSDDGPIFFHVLEKPDMLELRQDTVELDGLFLKVCRYPLTEGRTIAAPFFMGKSLRKLL